MCIVLGTYTTHEKGARWGRSTEKAESERNLPCGAACLRGHWGFHICPAVSLSLGCLLSLVSRVSCGSFIRNGSILILVYMLWFIGRKAIPSFPPREVLQDYIRGRLAKAGTKQIQRERERASDRATERQRVCVGEKKRAREKVNQSNPVAYTVDSLHIAYVSIPCVLRAWQQGHLDAVHKSPLHVQLIIGNSYNPSSPDLNKAWRNGSSATPSWRTWHSTTPRSSSPWRRVT